MNELRDEERPHDRRLSCDHDKGYMDECSGLASFDLRCASRTITNRRNNRDDICIMTLRGVNETRNQICNAPFQNSTILPAINIKVNVDNCSNNGMRALNVSKCLSPIKTSEKLLDISVNFDEDDSGYASSPRCVLAHQIFSSSFQGSDYLDTLIFGDHNVSLTIIQEQESRSSTSSSDDAWNTKQADCDLRTKGEYSIIDITNEGIVWKRLLDDLKSVRYYRVKGMLKDSNELVSHQTSLQINIQSGESFRCYDKSTKEADSSSIASQTAVTSTRTKVSKDALTVSTYAGSSNYTLESPLSGPQLTTSSAGMEEITVVDSRPFCRMFTRRFSMHFLYDKFQWTIDRDIALLLPMYSVLSEPTDNTSSTFGVERMIEETNPTNINEQFDDNRLCPPLYIHGHRSQRRKLQCLHHIFAPYHNIIRCMRTIF